MSKIGVFQSVSVEGLNEEYLITNMKYDTKTKKTLVCCTSVFTETPIVTGWIDIEKVKRSL